MVHNNCYLCGSYVTTHVYASKGNSKKALLHKNSSKFSAAFFPCVCMWKILSKNLFWHSFISNWKWQPWALLSEYEVTLHVGEHFALSYQRGSSATHLVVPNTCHLRACRELYPVNPYLLHLLKWCILNFPNCTYLSLLLQLILCYLMAFSLFWGCRFFMKYLAALCMQFILTDSRSETFFKLSVFSLLKCYIWH